MILLVAGLLLWTVAHGLKIHAPGLRASLAERFGEMAVKLTMTVVLIVALVMLVKGYQAADYVAVWTPPAFLVHLNNLLMVIAVAVYIAAPFKGHVRAWIRHPQLTGTKLWATAHLLVNGDLASIVLFGGILLWAVAAMVGVNKRDGKGPKPAPGTLAWHGIHIAVTLALVVGIGWVHNWAGYWPFPGSAPG